MEPALRTHAHKNRQYCGNFQICSEQCSKLKKYIPVVLIPKNRPKPGNGKHISVRANSIPQNKMPLLFVFACFHQQLAFYDFFYNMFCVFFFKNGKTQKQKQQYKFAKTCNTHMYIPILIEFCIVCFNFHIDSILSQS